MIVIADAHEIPGGLSQEFKKAICLARLDGSPLVCAGDSFNLIPYGLAAYMESRTVNELLSLLDDHQIILLEGNHDPIHWLDRLFKDHPNVIILKDLLIDDIYIAHGHRWGPLWSWLGRFANPLNSCANRYIPGTWYDIAKRMGWMPSAVQGEDRYHAVVLSLLIGAIRYSEKHKCKVAMGHSHKEYSLEEEGNIIVASIPPLVTGTILSVTDTLEFRSI